MNIEQPEISIIIPAYNEAHRLPTYLDSIIDYFGKLSMLYEIIVVDDGSMDTTAEIIEIYSRQHSQVRLLHNIRNMGKGYSVKLGMLAAEGKIRLLTDADGATPIAELKKLLHHIYEGADVVIGSRAVNDKTCRVVGHLHRKILGSIFNALVKLLVIRGFYDTQCGFKLFRGTVADKVFELQRTYGFGFDVEVLLISKINNLNIKEVGVNWKDIPTSKVNLIVDSIKMFIDLVMIRHYCKKGYYFIGSQLPNGLNNF